MSKESVGSYTVTVSMFLKICPMQIPNEYRKSPQLCPTQEKCETQPLIQSRLVYSAGSYELLL